MRVIPNPEERTRPVFDSARKAYKTHYNKEVLGSLLSRTMFVVTVEQV